MCVQYQTSVYAADPSPTGSTMRRTVLAGNICISFSTCVRIEDVEARMFIRCDVYIHAKQGCRRLYSVIRPNAVGEYKQLKWETSRVHLPDRGRTG